MTDDGPFDSLIPLADREAARQRRDARRAAARRWAEQQTRAQRVAEMLTAKFGVQFRAANGQVIVDLEPAMRLLHPSRPGQAAP